MSEREPQAPDKEVDIGKEARGYFQQQPQRQQGVTFEDPLQRQLHKDLSRYGASMTQAQLDRFMAGEKVRVDTLKDGEMELQLQPARDNQRRFTFRTEKGGYNVARTFPDRHAPIDPTPPSSPQADGRSPTQLDGWETSLIMKHYEGNKNVGDTLFEFQQKDGSSKHVFVIRNEDASLQIKPISGPEGYQDRVSAYIRTPYPEIKQAPAPVQPTLDEREAIIDFANAHARQNSLTRGNMPPVMFHNQDNGRTWLAQVEGGEFKISQLQKGDTIPAGTVQVQMNVPERSARAAPETTPRAEAAPTSQAVQSEYPVDTPTQLEEQMMQTTMGIEANQKNPSMLFRSGDHHFLATRTADHQLDIQPVADPKALGMDTVLLHDSDFKSWMESYEEQGHTAIVEEHRQRRGMAAAAPSKPEAAQAEQITQQTSQEQSTESGPQFSAVPDQQPVEMQPLPDDQKADSGTPVLTGQTSPARMAIEGSGNNSEAYHLNLQAAQHALAAVDPKYAKMMTYTAANGEERMADGLEGQLTRAAFEAFAQERGFDPRTTSIEAFIEHARAAKLEQENNLVDANRPDAWKDNIVNGYGAAAAKQNKLSDSTFAVAAKGPEAEPKPDGPEQGPKVQEKIANINMTQAMNGA
ncbi:MAG: hypothetical protein KDJ75_04920 [Alphaproteobacteria bacterium]|nr:hypothetical protein [Alphaproteobacteria bacterium]